MQTLVGYFTAQNFNFGENVKVFFFPLNFRFFFFFFCIFFLHDANINPCCIADSESVITQHKIDLVDRLCTIRVFFSLRLSFSFLPLLSYFLRLLMMANPYHDGHLARGLKIHRAVYTHCD